MSPSAMPSTLRRAATELGLYLDLQNVTFSKIRQPDAYLSTGEIVNPEDLPVDQRYALETLELWSGTIVPAIGVTAEF